MSLDDAYYDRSFGQSHFWSKLFPVFIIQGHNEFSAKACPCFDVKKELVPYFEKGSGE